jgi:hypothetical protein
VSEGVEALKPMKSRKPRYAHRQEFPEAKGRVVEMIELIADGECHCVSVRFEDSTDLTVMVEPALTFHHRGRRGIG